MTWAIKASRVGSSYGLPDAVRLCVGWDERTLTFDTREAAQKKANDYMRGLGYGSAVRYEVVEYREVRDDATQTR